MTARRDKAAPRRSLRLVRSRVRRTAPQVSEHPALWQRPRARTLAVASGKGGVGKSNVAANLAVALGERGARVLLLDADLTQANLDLLLGLHPRHDLQAVLRGERTLEEIVIEGPRGVRLIPASSGAPDLVELDDYRRECLLRGLGTVTPDPDWIVIDTASGVSRQVTWFCLAADDVLVVTTPEMPAFSDAYALFKLLQAQGLRGAPHLLVNMAGTEEEAGETARRIQLVARRFLALDIRECGHVPFDPAVGRSVRLQQPVVTAFPNAPAAIAYRALAERLWDPTDPALAEPGPGRLMPQKLEA